MKTKPAIQKPFIGILLVAVLAQFSVYAQTSDASTQTATAASTQTIYSNVALGKTATASSTDNVTHAASNAIDGNVATRFSSGYDDNQWLSVDLGKAYLLSNVILTWEKSYGKDFDILFSNTGTFTDLYIDSIHVRNHVLSSNNIAGIDSIKAKPGTVARYVRMQGIHRATSNGYSIWEMQVFGITSNAGLFPVSVSGFTATAATDASLLEWSSVTEYSNAGFAIEHSDDAVNFTQIGWINGRNTGTVISRYSFTDKQPSAGKNYYRLKQTWLDGKIGYSPVISINVTGNTNVNAYPVPVKDHLVVEYKGTVGENINVAIYNVYGLLVYNSKVAVQGGIQTMIINRTAAMNAGQYFLSINTASNKKYMEKIILQ